jgi:NAD(P)-dependent dehydrogenase (short-subunit alcohol dehydrogenase family)
MRLQDKVCILTGASSGMGCVATRMFCKQGARVVVADVVQAAGDGTVALARAMGQGEAILMRAISPSTSPPTSRRGPTVPRSSSTAALRRTNPT